MSPPAQIFTGEWGYAAALVFTDRARDLVITDNTNTASSRIRPANQALSAYPGLMTA